MPVRIYHRHIWQIIMKNPGIYIITSPSGKQYVGKDGNLPYRVETHLSGWNKRCVLIHRAIKKYGKENFNVEIIRYPGISPETLYAVEQWKIRQLNTKAPNGYNLTDGGAGRMAPHSEETKKKISETLTGTKKNPETVQKMIESRSSDEYRSKMSETKMGHKQPYDTRNKISETLKETYRKERHNPNQLEIDFDNEE